MQLTLKWNHYKDSLGFNNTVWCAQSPFSYSSWRLRPVLKDDQIKWIEDHDEAIVDHYGSGREFDTLIEAMQFVQDRHEYLAYNERVEKLEGFAKMFLNPKANHPDLVEMAQSALGLLPKEGE